MSTDTPTSMPPAGSIPPDELRRRIAAFPYWYHRIPLPGGIITPGWAPLAPDAYRVPADLSGMRVLDVGSWDGYWAFEAMRRGAKEALAIDDFSDYLGSLENKDRRAWENFDLCREALGFSKDRCQREEMSVFEVTPQRIGMFDVVFYFGTIYHVRYPLLSLDLLSNVCKSQIFVESAIIDDFSPYNGGFTKGYPGKQMLMEFYPGKQYGNNDSNWWAPSLYCLAQMVHAAGFEKVQFWKLTDEPKELAHCRGFVHGIKGAPAPDDPATPKKLPGT